MEESLRKLLEEKPIVIPKCLFNNYRKLNISEEELVILIYMINMGNKIVYNPEVFVKELAMDKFKVMEIINRLFEKKVINIIVEKNGHKKSEEYISLDFLYQKLMLILMDNDGKKDEYISSDVFSMFEREFGRCLSPMEIEIIKGWINQPFSQELIGEALKEATYNGASNLRYIDRVLFEWKKKGIKTKADVMRDRERFRKEKKSRGKTEVFDYNWLDDDE